MTKIHAEQGLAAGRLSRRNFLRGGVGVAGGLLVAGGTELLTVETATAATPAGYDRAVRASAPRVFYNTFDARRWYDEIAGLHLTFPNGHGTATTKIGEKYPRFDGRSQYAVRSDHARFSPDTTGKFTIEAWIRPDVLTFADIEQSGYVAWAGKGERSGPDGNREWTTRIYSDPNEENRGNRISGYLYGPQGGQGAGSYFQDKLAGRPHAWIHYVFAINTVYRSATYPRGYTRIWRDGVRRETASIARYPEVRAVRGDGRLRVGTRDGASFFNGGIAKFALYDRALLDDEVLKHYKASPLANA